MTSTPSTFSDLPSIPNSNLKGPDLGVQSQATVDGRSTTKLIAALSNKPQGVCFINHSKDSKEPILTSAHPRQLSVVMPPSRTPTIFPSAGSPRAFPPPSVSRRAFNPLPMLVPSNDCVEVEMDYDPPLCACVMNALNAFCRSLCRSPPERPALQTLLQQELLCCALEVLLVYPQCPGFRL